MNSIELENCSLTKLVCMILIVFYHSILFWSFNWFVGTPVFSFPLFKYISLWLNTFHIYTFVFVSGYLFYFNSYELNKYSGFSIYLKTRIKRLIIPYLFVSIFWVIPISCFFYKWNWRNIFELFLLGVSPSQLWFLLMLFGVCIIFFILKKIFLNHLFWGIILVLFSYCLSIYLNRFIKNYFQILSVLKFLPFYYMGFKVRQKSNCFFCRIPFFIYFILELLLLLVYIICDSYLKDNARFILKNFILFFLQIVGTLMCFFTIQYISGRIKKIYENKIYIFLKKSTMTIYLYHQQLIYFPIFFLNGIIHPIIHSMITFILSLVGSILISLVLHSRKELRMMIGDN